MADVFEGQDEQSLRQMLDAATDYEERQKIRKAIRDIKKAEGRATTKRTGTAEYRRMGTFQPPKQTTIPNSVTGNVMPDRVVTGSNKKEKGDGGKTVSYLNATTTQPPHGYKSRSTTKDKGGPMASPVIPVGRGSPSAYVRRSPLNSVGSTQSPRGSPRQSVSSTQSITPEPPRTPEPAQVEREPSPEPPPREPTPPPKEPTPPPREPTPPPREPTPPPREPTPPPKEPTPPPKEPTPPPREPTPPPKEPTPPPKEPTPEPEPEPEKEAVDLGNQDEKPDDEEQEGEEQEEEDEEEEGEEEEEDEDEEGPEYRSGRSGYSTAGGKDSFKDVTTEAEPGGVAGGDFRGRLRTTQSKKVDTTAAFPQARGKGEQVDFRDVLKNKVNVARKSYSSGSRAQTDFREQLKKRTSTEAPPPVGTKPSRSHSHPDTDDSREEEEEEEKEPEVEEEEEKREEEEEEREEEREEEEEEPVEEEEEETEEPAEEEVEEKKVEEGTDSAVVESSDSYEARRAARSELRQKSAERESKSKSPRPLTNGTPERTEEKAAQDPDSYEARREARRKAREERLKAASARMDEKKEPRMNYRERKAREQMTNARDNRKKWENREEESGDKEKAGPPPPKQKDSATGQLLAWCQHKTKYYENVEVKDFCKSWSNGMAFCAVLHSFLPDKIPYDDLSPDNPRQNFTIAFTAAKEAGIPEMLDVDDMLAISIPDSRSIMTFLVTIYRHFNN